MSKKKQNVLVTGGAGFIGHHLINLLLKKDKHDITVVDDFSTGDYKHLRDLTDVKLILGDFTEPGLLQDISEGKYEQIVHLAAIANIKQCEEDPISTFYNNCLNTEKLLHACSSKKVEKFVFASSCAVYGKNGPSWSIMDQDCNPVSKYGLQKQTAERMCNLSSFKFKNGVSCLRFFNVFGEDQKHGVVASWSKILAKAIINNQSVANGRMNGNPFRDYIYVAEICDVIFRKLKSTYTSFEDVGYGNSINLTELKEMLTEVSGYQGEFKTENFPPNSYDPSFVETTLQTSIFSPMDKESIKQERKLKLKQTFESYLKAEQKLPS